MIEITPRIRIGEGELHWTFVRAGGPGGQNVNKVASKAVLRWDVVRSPALPADVKARLLVQQRGRITTEGELLLSSQRFRDQGRNIDDCLDKLRHMIVQAATPPKRRKRTRPSRASHAARLQEKRRRTAVKKARRRPAEE
jgi:ribosome-associated protein